MRLTSALLQVRPASTRSVRLLISLFLHISVSSVTCSNISCLCLPSSHAGWVGHSVLLRSFRFLYLPSEWSETGGYTDFTCVCPCVCPHSSLQHCVCPSHNASAVSIPKPIALPNPSLSPTILLTYASPYLPYPLPLPLPWLPSLNKTTPYDLQWTFFILKNIKIRFRIMLSKL